MPRVSSITRKRDCGSEASNPCQGLGLQYYTHGADSAGQFVTHIELSAPGAFPKPASADR